MPMGMRCQSACCGNGTHDFVLSSGDMLCCSAAAGAMMDVALVNDGPVTFIVDSEADATN